MGSKHRLVVIDDDQMFLETLDHALRRKGYSVSTFRSAKPALQEIESSGTDALILDLKLGETDGLDVLRAAKKLDPDLVTIIITAYSTVATAVEAMKYGAYDYRQKPFDIDDLDIIVRRAIGERRLQARQDYVTRSQQAMVEARKLIGCSQAIEQVRRLIQKVAPTDCIALIQGESGTGKELVARHIHQASLRQNNLFIPVNAAAIPEALLESELFGHAKGSFTSADREHKGLFEVADEGTLFLDEISETSPGMQAKLLRAIEHNEIRPVGSGHPVMVNVRLICSTNAVLEDAVKAGRFRADLKYRLNVFPITIPPLRERREDIPLLAAHFLVRSCQKFRKRIRSISEEAMKIFNDYQWPGNVREMENVIERATIVEESGEIAPESLGLPGSSLSAGAAGPVGDFDGAFSMPLANAKAAFEKAYVEARLREAKQRETMTSLAENMGVHRTTLYELILRHKLKIDM